MIPIFMVVGPLLLDAARWSSDSRIFILYLIEINQRYVWAIVKKLGNYILQSSVLDLPGLPQAGSDAVKLLVWIPGMADQFPDARGHCGEHNVKRPYVESSGRQDSDGSIGGCQAGLLYQLRKHLKPGAEQADLSATDKGRTGRGLECPFGFERVSNGGDTTFYGRQQQRAENAGIHVGVLVCVNVRDAKAEGLQAADLRHRFDLNLNFRYSSQGHGECETSEGGTEASRRQRQLRKASRGQRRSTIHEHHMTPNTELTSKRCDASCGERGLRICHERCGRECPAMVKILNGLVDAGCKTKIIGVYDKAYHRPFGYLLPNSRQITVCKRIRRC